MTQLVAIINLTPDSFSGDGDVSGEAVWRKRMDAALEAGAEMVDIGAESTRPGATPLNAEEEWTRLAPFFEHIWPHYRGKVGLSVDSYHPQTAARVVDQGIDWLNDVSGASNMSIIDTLHPYGIYYVLMHALTIPADPAHTMAEAPEDCAQAIVTWAAAKIEAITAHGQPRDRIILDPGLGFGKTAAQSWGILQEIHKLKSLGQPILIGHSRKSLLKAYGETPQARDTATLAVSAALMAQKIDFLRVHNIAAHAQLRSVWQQLQR